MIILEGEADGGTKLDTFQGLTLRHPQTALTRSISPLPDYDTSEAEHRKVITPPERHRINPRIWKAGLYALIIYAILSLAIGIPLIMLRNKEQEEPVWPLSATSLWATEHVTLPTPLQLSLAGKISIGKDSSCNLWNAYPSSNNARALFRLSPTGLITIRSNVTYNTFLPNQISGSLSVAMNNDTSQTEALFDLEMQYSSKDLRRQTHVCFSENGSDRGLSIYIPDNLDRNDLLKFDIRLLLPRIASTVDNLVVYLPMFSQTYGDLRRYIRFAQVTLEGAGRPMTFKNFKASMVNVKNVVGPIEGTFNVTESISLDSIKGPITSRITLTKQPLRLQPTFLSIDSGDSSVNASVNLVMSQAFSSTQTSPSFVAQVKTFNGPLHLDVSYGKNSPLGPLQLQVQNNLAQSTVSFDEKYEGSFSAQTKLSEVSVRNTVESSGDDPTGGRRSRTMIYDQKSPSQTSGWVGWGPRPVNNLRLVQSYVEVLSALDPVCLTFGPS